MLISDMKIENLSTEQMTKLLYAGIRDDNKNGDCIFVPGSSKAVKYRLPTAVQLYKQGRANKLLFSGGVTWEGQPYPEAIMLKNTAISMGIPESAILVENQSLHTKENVLASLLVLEREFYLHTISRLVVVSSHYHMRRLHLTLKTYFPNWIDYTLCPANDTITTETNWYLTDAGRARVKAECEKLIRYVQLGALQDEDIPID